MDEIQTENENPDEGLPLNEYVASIFKKEKNDVICESIRQMKVRKVTRFNRCMIPIHKFINRHKILLNLYHKIKTWNKPRRQIQVKNSPTNYRSALTQQIKTNSNINQFNTFKDIQEEN